VENASGQMVAHVTPAASKRYVYDALGQLTDVQDTITGLATCAARKYGYDARGNRGLPAQSSARAPNTISGHHCRLGLAKERSNDTSPSVHTAIVHAFTAERHACYLSG
jgi:YD repeat-containing protein